MVLKTGVDYSINVEGGNRVLNYNNSISQIVFNRYSSNNRNLLPSELTQGNYGVPNDNNGVILFVPTLKPILKDQSL